MTSLNDEQLDAELAHLPFPEVERAFDDGLLHRYRRGELDEAGIARAEQTLLNNPRARAVLAESSAPVSDALIGRLERTIAPPTDEGTVASRVGLVMVAIALAASVVAWVMRPAAPDFVPQMSVTRVTGQIQAMRGADGPTDGPLRFAVTAPVKLDLVPGPDSKGALPRVTPYRVSEDGRLTAVPARVTVGEAAIRIEGTAGALFGATPGPSQLHLVLAPPDAAPSLARSSIDDARAAVCDSCWLTIDAEIVE